MVLYPGLPVYLLVLLPFPHYPFRSSLIFPSSLQFCLSFIHPRIQSSFALYFLLFTLSSISFFVYPFLYFPFMILFLVSFVSLSFQFFVLSLVSLHLFSLSISQSFSFHRFSSSSLHTISLLSIPPFASFLLTFLFFFSSYVFFLPLSVSPISTASSSFSLLSLLFFPLTPILLFP